MNLLCVDYAINSSFGNILLVYFFVQILFGYLESFKIKFILKYFFVSLKRIDQQEYQLLIYQ